MLDPAAIVTARERIQPPLAETPCLAPEGLAGRCGIDLFLKCESLQRTGSFKPRGALNRLLGLGTEERRRGVVAASAGNHAQGVAFAAAAVGIEALIVMPEPTPLVKISRTRELGAQVERHGETFDEAYRHGLELAAASARVFVPAFDDLDVVAGQGTVGLEILEQVPEVGTVVAPIGGGGLIAGIATAIKAARPETRILGVQSEAAPAMKRSFEAGSLTESPVGPTIAEGITMKRPGALTLPIVRRLVDGIALVSESEIEAAVLELLAVGKLLSEGAGAAAYAAVRHGHFGDLGDGPVVVVLSGANIDMTVLGRIVERALVRDQRLVRLRIDIRDRPGSLARLLAAVAEHDANVLDIHHERFFAETAFWVVSVELTLEIRDRRHLDEIRAGLAERGYPAIEELVAKPLKLAASFAAPS